MNIVLKVSCFDRSYEVEFGGMTHKEIIRYLREKHHMITGPGVKKMREHRGHCKKAVRAASQTAEGAWKRFLYRI